MNDDPDLRPMSVGNWFLTLLILGIPLVNVVMYLVWAFLPAGNVNRRNYCRAVLLWILVGVVLAILFLLVAGGLAMLTESSR